MGGRYDWVDGQLIGREMRLRRKPMNYQSGALRLWLIGSVLWLAGVGWFYSRQLYWMSGLDISANIAAQRKSEVMLDRIYGCDQHLQGDPVRNVDLFDEREILSNT